MRRTVSDDIIKSIGVINPMFHSFKTHIDADMIKKFESKLEEKKKELK